MEFKFIIFIVSAVLLVPFVYALPYLPDVCAAISDPGFRSSLSCKEKLTKEGTEKTCCWRVPIEGSILGQKFCQTCTQKCNSQGTCSETCTAPEKQAAAISGNTPDLTPDLTQDRIPGGVFEIPKSNDTFSQNDITNQSNNTLTGLQSDIDNDTSENNMTLSQANISSNATGGIPTFSPDIISGGGHLDIQADKAENKTTIAEAEEKEEESKESEDSNEEGNE